MLTEDEKKKLKNAAKTAAKVGFTCVFAGGVLAFEGAKKVYKVVTAPAEPRPKDWVSCSYWSESIGVMGIERIHGCSSEGIHKCGYCGGNFCAKHSCDCHLTDYEDREETSRVLSQWYQD